MNEVEKTIQSYEEQAEEYAKKRPPVEIVKEALDFFIKNLKGNKILDVGCAGGRDTQYFVEQKLQATGIDLAPSFVKIAKKAAPKATILKMDMRKLEFPTESFDGVWVNAVLLHIPKKEAKATILGFKRVLKPEGVLFLSVKQGKGEKFSVEDGVERFFAFYTQKELEQLLKETGFTIIKITILQKGSTTWLWTFASKPQPL